MSTTFLFVQFLDDEGCLCLSLDPQGKILSDCKKRSFSEIKSLQQTGKTILVASTQQFSLLQVELPWLNEKKARAALPFALEDQLAQNLDDLHFAFDRQHYAEGQYLVAVCDKNVLTSIISKLEEQEINIDSLTLDWFALEKKEACLLSDNLLINTEHFRGSLSPELLSFFLSENKLEDLTLYACPDSLLVPEIITFKDTGESTHYWIAKRLQQKPFMNLFQGEFVRESSQIHLKKWYVLASGMACLYLMSWLLIKGIYLHHLNHELAEKDAQIEVIYRKFFPNAQQVISPKFRITQLLKNNQNTSDQVFWLLLEKLSLSQGPGIQIEQLRYQNKSLQVNLLANDFDTLESLQTRLQQQQLTIKQTQASTRAKQVLATLELSWS